MTKMAGDGGVWRGRMVLVLLAAGLFVSLGYAPPFHDAEGNYLGESFRIFFYHVPSAWVSFLAFLIGCGHAVAALVTGRRESDLRSAAWIETGWIFSTVVIVTGPIWGKAAWGVFWSWEPRLVSFFVLWMLYLGYLMLRYSIDDRDKRRIYSGAVAILAFVEVPIVIFAIKLWGTKSHPEPGIGYFQEPAYLASIILNTVAYLAAAYHFVSIRLKSLGRESES